MEIIWRLYGDCMEVLKKYKFSKHYISMRYSKNKNIFNNLHITSILFSFLFSTFAGEFEKNGKLDIEN